MTWRFWQELPLPFPDGSPMQPIMICPLPRQWLVWGFARPHFHISSVGSTIWKNRTERSAEERPQAQLSTPHPSVLVKQNTTQRACPQEGVWACLHVWLNDNRIGFIPSLGKMSEPSLGCVIKRRYKCIIRLCIFLGVGAWHLKLLLSV